MFQPARQSRLARAPGGNLRVLAASDTADLRALLNRDSDAYAMVQERVEIGSLAGGPTSGQVWGWYTDSGLESAIYIGTNIVPVLTTRPAREAFATRLIRIGRQSCAIAGYQGEVLDLWGLLEPSWGPARDVRSDQPLMRIQGQPRVSVDSLVRQVRVDQIDTLLPASIAMFEEEVGVSPVAGGREESYLARLAATVRQGRAYARIRDGQVLFKAEIGAVSAGSAHLQGVWVAPLLRGTGMAAPGVAAVVTAAVRDHAPRVTLYVNSHNVSAIHAYARVGFEQIGTFATIMF